ncbi:cytochrome c oxidase subunit II [Sphingomonas sp.]|uniref:cytochrome c oxidase subunit II n=1 Tax=Sphingomonas sp. TaxID=28214 RepID=UPI001AFD702B|nr:cytochrome c oxidase subunit II [Sphingomonas sp.]MBO9713010.1 cytochrome c oxidase subunit II [Sphingomonas sp.]
MRILGLTSILMAAGLALSMPAQAQNAAPPPAPAPAVEAPAAVTGAATPAKPADPTLNADGTPKTAPVAHIGQPTEGWIGLQHQVTRTGEEALSFHDHILFPLITVISLFVLGLLIWVMFRYRRAAQAEPSKTAHNTVLEIVWTLLPVLILAFVALFSIKLLAHQFTPAPANAITLKAIGNQWFWSYEYPDNGGIQLTANMLKEKDEVGPKDRYRTDADGPRLLAADTRVVLPVGVPIRLLTTANDVIHSWAVPAFWIKLDAVPGKTNETTFIIEKPGVYFGQCSELCGARHGYMPIAVEAVSPEVFSEWVRSKGGTMPSDAKAAAAAPSTPAAAPAGNATDAAPAATGNGL